MQSHLPKVRTSRSLTLSQITRFSARTDSFARDSPNSSQKISVLAPSGLRTTQFSILAKLRRLGPMTINALAAEMVMDRTTLGRNILPLERDGLIAVEQGSRDRRSKELRVTEAGEARFRAGMKGWAQAQRQFEKAFGEKRTADMRAILHAVTATELGTHLTIPPETERRVGKSRQPP
jgi:DNA-binding MarR family transcriptional regulator